MNAKISPAATNRIEFRDESFHINDILKRLIVSQVSLEIPHGETLVLLGRSGSGKTTLLKLMNGMLLPTKGENLVQDRSTTSWDPIRALDPVTRAELQREFSALVHRLGKTIVFVTHGLREALLLASRIVLLEAGHVVARAAPQEFLHLDHPEVRAFTSSLSVTPGRSA